MRSLAALALVTALLGTLSAGCAGTSSSMQKPFAASAADRFGFEIAPQVQVPADSLVLLDQRLKSQLIGGSGGTATKVAVISINRYVTGAPVGIEAPANEIASTVTVRDAGSGAVLGSFVVESKNPGSWRTTGILLDDHADRIAAALKGRP